MISCDEFEAFCHRHRQQPSFMSEIVARFHLMLDQYMRFRDRDGFPITQPILEVRIEEALLSARVMLGL